MRISATRTTGTTRNRSAPAVSMSSPVIAVSPANRARVLQSHGIEQVAEPGVEVAQQAHRVRAERIVLGYQHEADRVAGGRGDDAELLARRGRRRGDHAREPRLA